ncbi:hypothetical protein COP2_034212 [Malus domestica]
MVVGAHPQPQPQQQLQQKFATPWHLTRYPSYKSLLHTRIRHTLALHSTSVVQQPSRTGSIDERSETEARNREAEVRERAARREARVRAAREAQSREGAQAQALTDQDGGGERKEPRRGQRGNFGAPDAERGAGAPHFAAGEGR